jgi:hypothetical protein
MRDASADLFFAIAKSFGCALQIFLSLPRPRRAAAPLFLLEGSAAKERKISEGFGSAPDRLLDIHIAVERQQPQASEGLMLATVHLHRS